MLATYPNMGLPYVHKNIPRDEAEQRVQAVSSDDGTFLLRKDKGKQTLVVMYKGKPTHHLIEKDDDGNLTVNKKKYGEFTTVKKVNLCQHACIIYIIITIVLI